MNDYSKIILHLSSEEEIDETFGVNVQFEASDDDVSLFFGVKCYKIICYVHKIL